MAEITISQGEATLPLVDIMALMHSGKPVDIKETQLYGWLSELLLLQNGRCKCCGFDKHVADMMCAAVDLMIRRGVLDSRSVLADIRMDYAATPPMSREKAEEMLKDVQA
jgi:hypothetical protein